MFIVTPVVQAHWCEIVQLGGTERRDSWARAALLEPAQACHRKAAASTAHSPTEWCWLVHVQPSTPDEREAVHLASLRKKKKHLPTGGSFRYRGILAHVAHGINSRSNRQQCSRGLLRYSLRNEHRGTWSLLVSFTLKNWFLGGFSSETGSFSPMQLYMP